MGGFLRGCALLGTLLLAGCYPPVLPQQISEVKPTVTTYDQVVATFGLPTAEANLSGGAKIAYYHLAEYDRGLFQLTPFLNLTEANYDTQPYDFFIFNREGVLESYSIPHFARAAGAPNPGS